MFFNQAKNSSAFYLLAFLIQPLSFIYPRLPSVIFHPCKYPCTYDIVYVFPTFSDSPKVRFYSTLLIDSLKIYLVYTMCYGQRPASYSCLFFFQQNLVPICYLQSVYGCSHATVAELSSYKRLFGLQTLKYLLFAFLPEPVQGHQDCKIRKIWSLSLRSSVWRQKQKA